MKLQNILDLSTFEIVRFRVWNQTSQPSDKGLGSKYFNTNSGHEAYGREQIYTPMGWRTAAYMDDVEAINEKLDLIFGDEIDTDTIIDSWKEVQDFLAGIEDTTTLMTMLGGKLDKSGGTITGDGLTIAMNGYPFIRFKSEDTMWGFIGFSDKGVPSVWDTITWRTLFHSGNANKTDVPWSASNILFPTGTSATWNIHSTNAYKGITVLNAVQEKPEGAPGHYAVGLSVSGYYGFTLASLAGDDYLLYRRKNDSDWKTIAFTDSDITGYAAGLKHANGTVGATVIDTGRVAFSGNISLELGKSILDPTGRSIFKLDSDNCPQIGFDTAVLYSTYINGKDVYLRYGSSRTAGLILNSSGNVGIGTTTPECTLDVAGIICSNSRIYTPYLFLGKDAEGIYISSTGISWHNSSNSYAKDLIGFSSDGSSEFAGAVAFRALATFNGGALIPTGKNMMFGDASGNAIMEYDEDANAIKVTGNFYATGTVASGGKAEEGSGTGGSATVYPFTLTYGQATYQIANPKSNTNVIVQVYEWNATTSSWDLILTDVNVTASKITVTFGRTTTVNHMVTVV